MERFNQKKRLKLGICMFLVLASLVVYLKVANCEFINYDDELYVTKNPHIQTGINLESIIWAFTTDTAANWHPLTWLSHMLDFKLYGLNPMGHHWTNLQIHIVNSILLFLFLEWISGAMWRSAFVSALFALHPLHVESVAWVSERKDVLCAFFWILSMWAYVRYVRNPAKKRYALLLVFFSLGLMAKPMIVTLPFVLLLIDFWPLERFRSLICEREIRVPKVILFLVWEKIPLFVLSAISSFITFIVQQHGGAVASIKSLSLKARIANAIVSYASYLGNMIWPLKLTMLYPIREWHIGQVVISGALIVLLTALAVRTWRRHPYIAVGWFWYLGTLVPVIGLVQVGPQRMADRYTYIPLIGVFIIIAWGLSDISKKWRYQKVVLSIFSGAVLLFLMVCTWVQVGYWQNGIALFKHTIRLTQNNTIAVCALGEALDRHGKYDDAVRHYLKALKMNPNYAEAHYDLGVTLERQGNSDAAVRHYLEALRIKPGDARVHNNIGVIRANQGKFNAAVDHYQKALQIRPDYAVAYYNLGIILANHYEFKSAIRQYQHALQFNPNMTQALYHLAWIQATHEDGKYRNGKAAVKLATKLCKITHFGQPLALDVLASAYAETGRFDAAVSTARKALKLALSQGPPELVSGIKHRLKLYQTGQPYHQGLQGKNES